MDEPQIIKTPSGEELVVLPRQDYDHLVNELAEAKEDLADIAVYDERMAELTNTPVTSLPAEVSSFMLAGHSRISALRHWRGLSLSDLASATTIEEQSLAEIEHRRVAPSDGQLAGLAAALQVPVTWIEQ